MNTNALIKDYCLSSSCNDPIKLAKDLMHKDYIPIHGPQHHIIDGACFMTALHNAGLNFDLGTALDELFSRAENMPGATCGLWGVCGSAASIGAALSVIHNTGPLSDDQYYKDNLSYVATALQNIAKVGGPRCCKRNAYISITTAIDFVSDNYHIHLPKSDIICEFSDRNKQCIKNRCPFFNK